MPDELLDMAQKDILSLWLRKAVIPTMVFPGCQHMGCRTEICCYCQMPPIPTQSPQNEPTCLGGSQEVTDTVVPVGTCPTFEK